MTHGEAQQPVQGLGLVFVAVYQRALKLLYVDALLERMKAEFAEQVLTNASLSNKSTTDTGVCSSSAELNLCTR